MTQQNPGPGSLWRDCIRASRLPVAAAVMLVIVHAALGCKEVSAIAYKVRGPEPVPAKYIPEQEPMLVLVENFRNPSEGYLDSERISQYLIAQLEEHKICPIVDQSELYSVRDRNLAAINRMSVAAIGKEAKAKQVLYVDLIDCKTLLAHGADTHRGSAVMRVKVIDVLTGDTRWPEHAHDGYPVTFETPIIRESEGVTRETVLDLTYRAAGDAVAKLFYTWQPDQ